MWIGKDEQGLVFLEEDWKSDRLPEDLVEEAGLLGTDFKNPIQDRKGLNLPGIHAPGKKSNLQSTQL